MNNLALNVSGIQPPDGNFVRLPATNTLSMRNIRPNGTATAHFGQFHWVAATNAPRTVVINIVPTTGRANKRRERIGRAETNDEQHNRENTTQFTIGT